MFAEDEFDLLDATIDPDDVESLARRNKLQGDIEQEKVKMKIKFLRKYALQESDPFKLWS